MKAQTYRTFLRTATGWENFSKYRKRGSNGGQYRIISCGLSFADAVRECATFNDSRTADMIERGTMKEFERDE